MATAATQHAPGNALDQVVEPLAHESNKPVKHDVQAELYYYKDPGDGTLPAPTYVGYAYPSLNFHFQDLDIHSF
jgi:hypothetical protein